MTVQVTNMVQYIAFAERKIMVH